jgi:TonB family protein
MSRVCSLILALALSGCTFARTSMAQAQGHAERRAVEKVAPVYPELAKRTHIRGAVKLELVVRANGTVKTTKVLGGSPVLIESATDAARKWKFETSSEETTEIVELMFEPRER